MIVHVVPHADAAGEAAAELIAAHAVVEPDLLLGVATGSSPGPVYRALARRVAAGLDLHQVRAAALDEYVGLPRDHPESYRSVVAREVVAPLRLDPARVRVPSGDAPDLDREAAGYEDALRAAGGAAVQLLGIGDNGHIAFNEPGSAFDSRTRVVRLTAATRRSNARFFGGDLDAVPSHALTQGIATILSARRLVLIASGGAKAPAVAAALTGPLDESCPASALRLHPEVTVLLDPAAAALLDPDVVDRVVVPGRAGVA